MTRSRRRRPEPQQMSPQEALETVAYSILRARGQTANPTMHDIMLAVVQASPLLDITINSQAAKLQLAAADKLAREHKWDIGKAVLLKSGFAKPKRQTTTAHPPGEP